VLYERYPGIQIAGAEPSRFRRLDPIEKSALVARIQDSGAAILFVGLGCPRQEVFAFELGRELHMPILAVGAAFPFLAGHIPQAPVWMQARGLEWLYRLGTEPRRLWRRYLYLNPTYIALVILQGLGLPLSPERCHAPVKEELYG
jgi:N-acetylglucosaminyldiphosphoundecaprenol N-acetyl-beta-D-mannosaminyltransferase